MNIVFSLRDITGAQLFRRFAEAITQQDVGFEDAFDSRATLSEDRCTWKTAWSGFSYTINNPDEEDKPAWVEYEGAVNGFLKQELIPQELKGLVTEATIVGGSAYDKHNPGVSWVHHDAGTLAKVYRLMQQLDVGNGDIKPFTAAVKAVEAAADIENYLDEKLGPVSMSATSARDASRCYVEVVMANRKAGGIEARLELFVEALILGEQVRTSGMRISQRENVIVLDQCSALKRAKQWIDRCHEASIIKHVCF